jgi:hypothetical protein
MSRRAFLCWSVTGALVGAIVWPCVMLPGTQGIPLTRWACYLCWSAVLGWIVWTTIGGLVELGLSGIRGGNHRAWATFYGFGGTMSWLVFPILFGIPVDDDWRLFDPVLPTSVFAFGTAMIRIRTRAVAEDLQRLRSRRSLIFSVPMLVLAYVLMGHLVKVFYFEMLLRPRL